MGESRRAAEAWGCVAGLRSQRRGWGRLLVKVRIQSHRGLEHFGDASIMGWTAKNISSCRVEPAQAHEVGMIPIPFCVVFGHSVYRRVHYTVLVVPLGLRAGWGLCFRSIIANPAKGPDSKPEVWFLLSGNCFCVIGGKKILSQKNGKSGTTCRM